MFLIRVRFLSLFCLAVLTASLAGASAAHWQSTRPIPTNVHPALAQTARATPTRLVSVIINQSPSVPVDESALARVGARVTERWPFIHSLAAEVPATNIPMLAAIPGVRMLLPDNTVATTGKGSAGGGGGGGGGSGGSTGAVNDSALVNSYNYAVQAERVWSRGYDGKGITVAVVDSGITNGTTDFGSRVLTNVVTNSNTSYNIDKYGHGTHVAGIIAGDGRNSTGKYIGIAPGANLLNVKFSDDAGTATERDLVNALQWVYDNRAKYNIRVVNISASVNARQSYRESPTAAAVEQLWFGGVVVVVSAGNNGTESCSVCSSPAHDPYVITVGAIEDMATKQTSDDVAVAWSSHGVTLDGHKKPDLVASGTKIVSYMPTGALRSSSSKNVVDRYYFRMGGTSMSAPIVTGVVALMLQVKPELTPDQVKWIMGTTARTYNKQPVGTPGIVNADGAAFYNSQIGLANQGLTPSPMISQATGSIDYSNAYWSNAYWSNAYWSNSLSY